MFSRRGKSEKEYGCIKTGPTVKTRKVSSRDGLVGYDVAFTRLRSRVQFPLLVFYIHTLFIASHHIYNLSALPITCLLYLFIAPLIWSLLCILRTFTLQVSIYLTFINGEEEEWG